MASNIRRVGDSVEVTRWILDRPAPPLFARVGGFNGNVDRWMNCRFEAPSSVLFDIGCAAAGSGAVDGDRGRGVEIGSLHGITSEAATSSHYFWAYARNFALDDLAMTTLLRAGAEATFTEDVVVLER